MNLRGLVLGFESIMAREKGGEDWTLRFGLYHMARPHGHVTPIFKFFSTFGF